MSKNLRLSIIVPVYNVEKWLVRCLDSLYNQGLSEEEFEVIVVNDGSPDNSLRIANEYALNHTNMHIITRENGGLSAARNTGLDHVTGNYVWFVDSDDFIEPNSIQNLLCFAEENKLDVLCYNLQRFYEDGHKWVFDNDEVNLGKIYSGEEFVSVQHMPDAAWAAIYRYQFLKQSNLRFYEGILHEDIEFTSRTYYMAKRICYKNRAIYNYFQRKGSIMKSNQREKRVISYLRICDSLYSFQQKNVITNSPAYNYFTNRINFCFSQVLSHWNKNLDIKLLDISEKPYYPLVIPIDTATKDKIKYRLANISLWLYCKIKDILR